MKFGKHIQKRQLEIPEYAPSFVDYKALKKLIKRLISTPSIAPQVSTATDTQTPLQAEKAAFFFRLERELDKVNKFYLQKEAELKLRLDILLERKTSLHERTATTSTTISTVYSGLEEGLRLFNGDLDKLQQFIEINQTAFSKILKKWDRASKSRTKELYLSRAVEVQPCFDRDVISDLSDKATTSLLELGAWAEGENLEYIPSQPQSQSQNVKPSDLSAGGNFPSGSDDSEVDSQVLKSLHTGQIDQVLAWLASQQSGTPYHDLARQRASRLFLACISTAPLTCQRTLCEQGYIDIAYRDEINQRTCLHELAISGRVDTLELVLQLGADVTARDVHRRLPLHYAAMHGRVDVLLHLLGPSQDGRMTVDTIDALDVDAFTPLILAIANNQPKVARELLQRGAMVDPRSDVVHIPLNLACQHGSALIVQLLLQANPKILPDAEGLYPQHLAARSGHDPTILLMLAEFGASLDRPDKLYQWTPIFHAASEGHLATLQTLIRCNVDVQAIDEKGYRPAHYAAWDGKLDCLRLLEQAQHSNTSAAATSNKMTLPAVLVAQTPSAKPPSIDPESIPDLSLPPPIIPLRRYGHNFLDTTKTFIVISFDTSGDNAIRFYGDTKHLAARLAISSKSSDLIPRNITLPMRDEHKIIAFQIENLETFSIEFDVYPTFGSKVIARGAASSTVFTSRKSSSGYWHLELFDPRLRASGRLCFDYQVVTPFREIPMETTQFATYWKATSQLPSSKNNNAPITGSSLAGDYLRLCVQTTRDMVPVVYPHWAVSSNFARFGVLNDLIGRLTFDQLTSIMDYHRTQAGEESPEMALAQSAERGGDMSSLSRALHESGMSLKHVLARLPVEMHVAIHVMYPTRIEEDEGQLGPTSNMNAVIDATLSVVFEHASKSRAAVTGGGPIRSIVFSSFNPMICTALNWKQPNYPVLLCNNFGATDAVGVGSVDAKSPDPPTTVTATVIAKAKSDEANMMSIKDAVAMAQSNNFMGLMCSRKLLELVPSLVESIKSAGLVLVMDLETMSHAAAGTSEAASETASETAAVAVREEIKDKVDGTLEDGGSVLRFKDTVDV